MKYTATVEIEFETDVDPLMILHNIMGEGFSRWQDPAPSMGEAKHYHIIEQPRPECGGRSQ